MPFTPTRARVRVAVGVFVALTLATFAGASAVAGNPSSASVSTGDPASASRGVDAPQAPFTPAPATRADKRPNILLITTDDQTLSDMKWMPLTRSLLADKGITFTDMLSPHPLCCPARAELLTGQFAQNNGVRSNAKRFHGGYSYLDPTQTIATWVHGAGYSTAMVGKYLNEYGAENAGPEPGWDIWNPTITGVYDYFGYTMYNEGNPVSYDQIHNVDLVAGKTVEYIDRLAGDRPFFIWSSQVAPHAVCDEAHEGYCSGPPPAPTRFAKKFARVVSPSISDPAFNEKDVSDKERDISTLARVDRTKISTLFRARIRTLLAVDEGVAAAVTELDRTGELDNTLILFTTDNGFLLGEHRYVSKNVPYEQAVHTPLLVRGPGLPAGQTRDQTVTLVDLAATILDATGARATLTLDGRSVLPIAVDNTLPGYDTVLIQAGPRHQRELPAGWAFRGVRTDRYTYVRFPNSGFEELYDHKRDPYELTNVAAAPRYRPVLRELRRRARLLGPCAGQTCRQLFGAVPSPGRRS